MRLIALIVLALSFSGCGVYVEMASGAIGTTGFVREVRRAEVSHSKKSVAGEPTSLLESLVGAKK